MKHFFFALPFYVFVGSAQLISSFIFAMTNDHISQLATCVQDVIKAVGPCGIDTKNIWASGRGPDLQSIAVDELVDPAALQLLPRPIHGQLSKMVLRRLMSIRQALLDEFHGIMSRLYSAQQYGITDGEVEDQIIRMIEVSYKRSVQNIRDLLAKVLRRYAPTEPVPRGGFGDVSPSTM
jgi:hypothetical protein